MAENVFVLDACALIAVLRGEPGEDRVLEVLAEPESRVLMHVLNLCEVYYDALRRDSETTLSELLESVATLGVELVHDLGVPLVEQAGRIKAERRRVSLADCVGLATALEAQGLLLTTDHHELDALAEDGLPIRFVR